VHFVASGSRGLDVHSNVHTRLNKINKYFSGKEGRDFTFSCALAGSTIVLLITTIRLLITNHSFWRSSYLALSHWQPVGVKATSPRIQTGGFSTLVLSCTQCVKRQCRIQTGEFHLGAKLHDTVCKATVTLIVSSY
jgi:hypothetical protein